MGQIHTIGKTATAVYGENGYTCVRYHQTVVIKFNDKSIILNSGGWRSNTTKTRINQASNQFDLGVHVYQDNFQWLVLYNGVRHEFEDGMRLLRKRNR